MSKELNLRKPGKQSNQSLQTVDEALYGGLRQPEPPVEQAAEPEPEQRRPFTSRLSYQTWLRQQQMAYWGPGSIQEQVEAALNEYFDKHAEHADRPLPEKELQKLMNTKKPRR